MRWQERQAVSWQLQHGINRDLDLCSRGLVVVRGIAFVMEAILPVNLNPFNQVPTSTMQDLESRLTELTEFANQQLTKHYAETSPNLAPSCGPQLRFERL